MNEAALIAQLQGEGFDNVWVYEAEPDEIDEEHQHDYDTKLVVLSGEISITQELGGAVTNILYKPGQEIIIPHGKPHAAKVGHAGCHYIVAEKHV